MAKFAYIHYKGVGNNLKIDDDSENKDGGKQVHQIWKVLAVERLAETTDLVLARRQEVKQSNDGSFELSS